MLQSAADPPPFRVLDPPVGRAGRQAPLLLVCDHASPAIPTRYRNLGLDAADLSRHIAWDIGAALLTERLSAALGAPAILSGVSRLVIDCNRNPADPTLVPEVSDGTRVPGNCGLAAGEIAARIARYHEPYHCEIAARMDALAAYGAAPALIAIHSFTPALAQDSMPRPWHVGVLWDRDPRLALPLLDRFRSESGLVIGDNKPYSATGNSGYTLRRHGAAAGRPHVLIEVRQDLIAAKEGVAVWAGRLAHIFGQVLAAACPFALEFF